MKLEDAAIWISYCFHIILSRLTILRQVLTPLLFPSRSPANWSGRRTFRSAVSCGAFLSAKPSQNVWHVADPPCLWNSGDFSSQSAVTSKNKFITRQRDAFSLNLYTYLWHLLTDTTFDNKSLFMPGVIVQVPPLSVSAARPVTAPESWTSRCPQPRKMRASLEHWSDWKPVESVEYFKPQSRAMLEWRTGGRAAGMPEGTENQKQEKWKRETMRNQPLQLPRSSLAPRYVLVAEHIVCCLEEHDFATSSIDFVYRCFLINSVCNWNTTEAGQVVFILTPLMSMDRSAKPDAWLV